MIPAARISSFNGRPPSADGEYVLYWMTAFRRPHFNFALERAVELANQLNKPLLVLEPLRIGYRWNCDRFHRFIIEGMHDNQAAFEKAGVRYLPFIEKKKGSGHGLVEKLASRSAAIVTDDCPAFFFPAILRKFASAVPSQLESVDSNGIYPMRLAPKIFSRAHFFRIHLQKNLKDHLMEFPEANPLASLRTKGKINLDWLPKKWLQQLPDSIPTFLSKLSIDHSVNSIHLKGGFVSGQKQLAHFITEKLGAYEELRNHPDKEFTSGLSGHLHFGHVSPHQIFAQLAGKEEWSPTRLAPTPTKKATGWWGMSAESEAFLDQVITWRELGFNMAWQDRGYTKYSSLPNWVQVTLDEHRNDNRDPCYSLEEFEHSQTHDPLWNAAQNQLRQEGRIHNYLRMLWGKKILHWSASPEDALRIMIELNNKYAIDGRDPNSYSGIFWVMGRYDRAWGPERPIFGKIRYMASENTARKFPVKGYLSRFESAE